MKEIVKQSAVDAHTLQNLAQVVLEEAKRMGADQAEVDIAANKGFTVSAHDGDVETVEYTQDKVIDVTVYFGKRSGSASLSDLRVEAIHDAVKAACHIAKFTDEDSAAGLPDREDLAFNYPQLDLAYPWHISVEEAIRLACECEAEARALDSRILSAEESRVVTEETFYVYANSLGFVGAFPRTHHEISCVLVAKDKDEMQRDYSFTMAVDPKQLMSTRAIAEEAVERTVRRLGAKRLPTMKVPVLYVAEKARGLLGTFASAISGGAIYRKSSFLLDHLHKQIFPDFFHIQEHPYLAKGLGSAPFDDDGVATRENVFIENGILNQYALGVYSARKLGMKPTGNGGGMHNLTLKSGQKNLAELLKTMDRGLLLTETMGQGVNLLTGDYSRGAAGFWVENGEIQYPVHEITVAGKLQDIFKNIAEIGSDVDTRGNIRTGSLLINEMMVAGN